MKFCDEHWQALRAAIDAQGVSHLIAKDGAAAARAMAREIEGTSGPDDYDPLMSAHNMIVSRAMDELGALVVISGQINECPVCACEEAHRRACTDEGCTWSVATTWIPGAAHGAAEHARSLLRTEAKREDA